MLMRQPKTSWIISGVVVAAVAIFIALFNWNWLRGPLATYLSAKLDRKVSIEGDLHGQFSLHPMFTADSVVIANVPTSNDKEMARIQRVGVRLDVWSLIRGPLTLQEVALAQPRVILERDADGKDNWTFGSPAAPATAPPRVGQLTIDDGLVHFRDAPAKTDVTMKVASKAASETTSEATSKATAETAKGGSMPVTFQGTGTLRGNAFRIDGSAATLLALENEDRPYRLDVKAKAGDTSVGFNGQIVPSRPDNVDGTLSLQGRDLSQLYPIIPVPLPWTPAYSLKGQLRHEGTLWSFQQFLGKVGASDLSGKVTVDRKNERPLIVADLVSQQMNYKDLGGLVGLPPLNAPTQSLTNEQNREVTRHNATERVLPTRPYELERLRVADAKVHLRGKHFQASDLPLDDVNAVLDLQDGVVKLQPLDFGVGGGRVVLNLNMDAREKIIKTKGDITVRNVEVSRVMPSLKPPKGSAGKMGGKAQFATTGNSIADMLATVNGEVALISTGGEASELAVVLSNLDLANAVQLLLKGDASSPIRCVVADFVADDGVMNAKTMIADTGTENIQGSGSVDFKKEQYDLQLKARSKKPSLVALRGPIVVTGTFKHPVVGPAVGPLALRVGASVALGVVLTPVAALLPLIDFGGAPDADCRGLIDDAHDNVKARVGAVTASSRN